MIGCGENYTVVQNEKNEIYMYGNDKNQNKIERIEYNFGEIKKIACGGGHIVIQNEKNEIYVCGYNEYGQLGLCDYKNRNKFEKVKQNFGEIKNIVCGEDYTIIQNEKNEVYVCGYNVCGYNGCCQFGFGNYEHRCKFEKVEKNFGEIKNIACGSHHIMIQNEKNEVYACGGNYNGQLGLGDNRNRDKFEKADYDFGKIKKTVCGESHTIIQNEKNEIYVCGNNYYGQLGLGDNKNRHKYEKVEYNFGEIKKIVCGVGYTIIQNEKNEVHVCGFNVYGQLGLGDDNDRRKFEKVECNFGEIKNIACGFFHTVIQNEKNTVYACGFNRYGQLGLGDNKDRNVFEIMDTRDVFEKIYNFVFQLNTEEIAL